MEELEEKFMNRATRIVAATMGVFLGISGLDHGFFEILQGNTPTNGLFIRAIGPDQIMWFYGGEEAFTILPTFLLTGISAILVGIALIIWSVGFLDRKHGATVLLVLTILLFLLGGGIAAPIIFGPFAWGTATRINKPLSFWQKVFPKRIRGILGKLWPYTLTIAMISLAIGLYIAITGHVPGFASDDPEQILTVTWLFVFGGGWGMFLLSILSGFAFDIEQRETGENA
jgi:hypothetical protein